MKEYTFEYNGKTYTILADSDKEFRLMKRQMIFQIQLEPLDPNDPTGPNMISGTKPASQYNTEIPITKSEEV